MAYFFDTYALIELLKKNPAYERFIEEPVNTSVLNLGELQYCLLKKGINKDIIDSWYERLRSSCIEIDAEYVKKAMYFKFENKSKSFSFIDCIGYITSRENGLVFLTGDKEFKGLDSVEYVK